MMNDGESENDTFFLASVCGVKKDSHHCTALRPVLLLISHINIFKPST
jgi:hypothetical protein